MTHSDSSVLGDSHSEHPRPYPQAVHRVHIPACEVQRGDLVSDAGTLRVVLLNPVADDLMGVEILTIHFCDGGEMPALPGGLVTVYRLEY